MKENHEIITNDRKPQGMASVPPRAKRSEAENTQHKGGEKKKAKSDRLSRAAGQGK